MASPIASLIVEVGADVGGATAALGTLNTQIGTFTSTATTALPASALLAGAGVGIAAGFVDAFNAAADFEKQMSGVKAVMSPTDVQAFGQALSDLALQLGKDTTFTAREAAGGIEELIKAGIPAQDVLGGAAKAALDLAAATGIPVSDAATIAAQAMNAFRVNVGDLGGVVDFLAGTANASAADMTDLKFGLQAVGAVAATTGLSFQDTSVALGLFANNGLRGQDAGTSLKTMLINLIPHTKAQANEFTRLGLFTADNTTAMAKLHDMLANTAGGMDAMKSAFKDGNVTAEELYKVAKKLGVVDEDSFFKWAQHAGLASNAFFDASGKMKSFAEVAGILQTALAGETEEQKLQSLYTLFGTDAMRAASITAKEGADGVSKLNTEVSKISAAQSAAERLNNFAGATQQLQGSVETLSITMGQRLLPIMTTLAKKATDLVNAFLGLPESVQTMIAIGTAVTGVLLLLAGGIGLAAVVLPPVIAGFGALGAVFGAVAAFAAGLALPIAVIVGVVALLAAAWINNWGDIQGKTSAAVSAVTAWVQETLLPTLQSLGDWLATTLPPIIAAASDLWTNTLLPALQGVGDWLGATLPPLLEAAAGFWTGTLQPAIANFVAWSQATLLPFLGAVADFWLANVQLEVATLAALWTNTLLPALQATAAFFNQYVLPPFQALADLIGNVIGGALNQLATLLGPIADAIGGPFAEFVKNLQSGVTAAFTAGTTNLTTAAADTRAQAAGVAPVQINVGGVTVTSEADENRLVDKIAALWSGAAQRATAAPQLAAP